MSHTSSPTSPSQPVPRYISLHTLTLLRRLRSSILTIDGAFGSYIKQKFPGDVLTPACFHGVDTCPDRFPLPTGAVDLEERGETEPEESSISLAGNVDLLNITQPHLIKAVMKDYLDSGSDFIMTCSFSSSAIEQSKFLLDQELANEIAFASARNAREILASWSDDVQEEDGPPPRFILGSAGPLSKTLSIGTDVSDSSLRDVTFEEVVDSYEHQIREMIKGGCDVIAIETIFDVLNAKAAIVAIERMYAKEENSTLPVLPVMISATLETSGRTLSGQTVEAYVASVSHCPNLISIGLNCGQGGSFYGEYLQRVILAVPDTAERWIGDGLNPDAEVEDGLFPPPVYVHVYPNAGLPNEFGDYDQTPEQFCDEIEDLIQQCGPRLRMIGGCCGTRPSHIEALAKLVRRHNETTAPVVLEKEAIERDRFLVCGLEPLTYVGSDQGVVFVNIGERCNVAGSMFFRKLIVNHQYDRAISVARKQVDAGAQILDVCVDEPLVDAVAVMRKLLCLFSANPEIAKVPIMIDSSNFDVVVAGLGCLQGKAIVNSLSLKNGPEEFLERARLIRRYGAAVVVMAFDESGQAVTKDQKVAVCKRAYDLLVEEANFPPWDIIFDPNVLTIGTGVKIHNPYAVEFIESCKEIKKCCPFAKISGGVSNLSFSFRGMNEIREPMHAVFLHHALHAGLDMAIVNTGRLPLLASVDSDLLRLCEDLVLNKHDGATRALLEYAQARKDAGADPAATKRIAEWRTLPIAERLCMALLKGIGDHMEADLEAILLTMDALSVIEGPLMDGMNRIGVLFGEGQMFLPQVIQSARAMKQAIEILEPHLAASDDVQPTKEKILTATVKGDVHDIGKNIVGVVLECNGYSVVDLGVMQQCNHILSEARKQHVTMIGLSGLITPSLEEMVFVAKEMHRTGFEIPLLIGGASTSEMHTAVKIAPYYWPVIHVADATCAVAVVSSLLSARKDAFLRHVRNKYDALVEEFLTTRKTATFLPIELARQKKLTIPFDVKPPACAPSYLGPRDFTIPIDEYKSLINWFWFLNTWGMKPEYPYDSYPEVLNHPTMGAEAKKLIDDSMALLEALKDHLVARCILAFYRANSVGDDIAVFGEGGSAAEPVAYFRGLRQQREKENSADPWYCISDFVAPASSGLVDHIAVFVGAVFGEKEILEGGLLPEDSDYNRLILGILCDRLAEALAEHMHRLARGKYWGYTDATVEERFTSKDLFRWKYQGIRPALGYPSQPDHQEKYTVWSLLGVESRIGVTLTESTMMVPKAATCSLFFSHPMAKYFPVGKIGEDQVRDYAARKESDFEKVEGELSPLLSYK